MSTIVRADPEKVVPDCMDECIHVLEPYTTGHRIFDGRTAISETHSGSKVKKKNRLKPSRAQGVLPGTEIGSKWPLIKMMFDATFAA